MSNGNWSYVPQSPFAQVANAISQGMQTWLPWMMSQRQNKVNQMDALWRMYGPSMTAEQKRDFLGRYEAAVREIPGMSNFQLPSETVETQPPLMTGPTGAPTGPFAPAPPVPGAVPYQPPKRTEQIAVPRTPLEDQTFSDIYKNQPQVLAALQAASYPIDQPISQVNATFGAGWRAVAYYAGAGGGTAPSTTPSATPAFTPWPGVTPTPRSPMSAGGVPIAEGAPGAAPSARAAVVRPGTFGSVAPWLLDADDPKLQALGNARIPPPMLDADGFPDPSKVEAWLKAQPTVDAYLRALQEPTFYERERLARSETPQERQHREYLVGVRTNIQHVVTAVDSLLNKTGYPTQQDAANAQKQAHAALVRARQYIAGEVQAGRMTQEEADGIVATLPQSFMPSVAKPTSQVTVSVGGPTDTVTAPDGRTYQRRWATNQRTGQAVPQYNYNGQWIGQAEFDRLTGGGRTAKSVDQLWQEAAVFDEPTRKAMWNVVHDGQTINGQKVTATKADRTRVQTFPAVATLTKQIIDAQRKKERGQGAPGAGAADLNTMTQSELHQLAQAAGMSDDDYRKRAEAEGITITP